MQLVTPFATLALLLTTVVTSIIATPMDQSPNDAEVQQRDVFGRAAPTPQNYQCLNPVQINLSQDPGTTILTSCGWKKWAACTALAAGVCLAPCYMGGFADPACDLCIGAMGTLGCKSCIENKELWTWLSEDMASMQPQVVKSLQSQYCDVPKLNYVLAGPSSKAAAPTVSATAPATA